MHFDQIANDLTGREDKVHPAMQHGPPITDIGAMETGGFSSFLKDPDGRLFSQAVQVDTAGMAVPENVFNQDLGVFQVSFIPIHPAAEGINLEPLFSNLFAFLLILFSHKNPPPGMNTLFDTLH
jgi:hypothetical protein